VQGGHVRAWDDPRMPTLCGLRRRGCPPEALRDFCARIGVARADAIVDHSLLEFCMRERLNDSTPRIMAVLDPIKVVIENYPETQVEMLDMPFHPEDPDFGSRKVPFARELYIEREDFAEAPPPKFHRLAPGREVRLRYAYFVTCKEVLHDASGKVAELRCEYDPASRGGSSPDGRKVKGTLHWVAAQTALTAEARLYEHLFTVENPGAEEDFLAFLNPDSLRTVQAKLEPALAGLKAGDRVQFERLGYFCVDEDSAPGRLVFNRTVTLKDPWGKQRRAIS
jgi:glutaminyl-tRNA synthetase